MKKPTIATFIISFLLVLSTNAFCQQLNQKVSIVAHNKTIIEILSILGKTESLTFSFNSKIVPKGKRTSINRQHVPLKTVLNEVLTDTGISFKEINGIIVLYKIVIDNPVRYRTATKPSESAPSETKQPPTKRETPLAKKPRIYVDTVIHIRIDTLIHHDTIHVYDTTKQVINDTLLYIDTLRFNQNLLEKHKHSIAFYYSPLFFGPDLATSPTGNNRYLEAEKRWDQKFLGVSSLIYSRYFGNFSVSSGIQYFQLNENLNHTFQDSTVYYTEIVPKLDDQLYYDTTYSWNITLPGEETSADFLNIDTLHRQITIYDTLPKRRTINGTRFNLKRQIAYISIPLLISYKIKLSKRFDIGMNAGAIASFLVTYEEYTSENNFATKNDLSPFILVLLAEAELGYRLNNDYSIQLATGYAKATKSIYKPSFPLQSISQMIKASVGIKYFF